MPASTRMGDRFGLALSQGGADGRLRLLRREVIREITAPADVRDLEEICPELAADAQAALDGDLAVRVWLIRAAGAIGSVGVLVAAENRNPHSNSKRKSHRRYEP